MIFAIRPWTQKKLVIAVYRMGTEMGHVSEFRRVRRSVYSYNTGRSLPVNEFPFIADGLAAKRAREKEGGKGG